MNLIGFRALGYGQYVGLAASTALTTAPTTGTALGGAGQASGQLQAPGLVLLQAEGQNIRWTDDGTVPTATLGTILYVGADPFPYSGDLSRLKFIQVAATATLNVSYYGPV